MGRRTWAALGGVVALSMAACGGGGGGGDTAATPSASTPQALALTVRNMSGVVSNGVGSAESVLQTAQFVVDLAQRVRLSGASQPLTETCPNGGLNTVTLQDRDGSGRLSAGDRLVVEMRDCGVAGLEAIFAGTATVTLSAVEDAPSEGLRGSLDLGSAGVLVTDPSDPSSAVAVRLAGSLAFEWTRGELATSLRVLSTSADDLRVFARGNGLNATDAYRSVELARSVRYDEARVTTTLAMRVDSEIEGGSFTLSTPVPLKAYLNTYPEVGRLEIRGAGVAVIRVKARFVTASEQFDTELDINGDGAADTTVAAPWRDITQGYLWWDGVQPVSWSSSPFSTQAFVATDFRAQALGFGTPGVNQVFRLQFSRPALATPIAMRFRDDTFRPGVFQRQDVAATVVQHGALFLIRPATQLRHGSSYTLELSSNGVDWGFPSITVRDALNNTATLFGQLGSFTTADNLKAVITSSSQLLTSASASLELSASGSVSTLRPIRSYRWTQVGGTPLAFSAPDAAQTRVQWGATPPKGIEAIVVELTVTDTAGEVSTSRVSLNMLNQASAARVLYVRGTTGDYISGGQTILIGDSTGSFTQDPVNSGYISYFFNSVADFWSLSLGTAGGAPFKVGAYENAIRAPFRDQQNGIDLSGAGRGCNQIYGRFDVLELRTDAQNVITGLAVDFEQRCESPQAPPLFGSLRINSSVPIRP